MSDLMKLLDRSEDLLCKGLEEITAKGELNAASMETLGEVLDGFIDIDKIREAQEMKEYSRRSRYAPMYGNYDNYMGHYRDQDDYSRRMSYGQNDIKARMLEQYRQRLAQTTNEAEKDRIRWMISELENN